MSTVSADDNGSCNYSTSLKTPICKESGEVKHVLYQRLRLKRTPRASGAQHICVELLLLLASELAR